MSDDDAIGAFWAWWKSGGAREAADAVTSGEMTAVAGKINPLIEAIGPGLQWELGRGPDGRNELVVTAAGDPSLRAVARAWLGAALSGNADWTYADLRQPDPNASDDVVEFDGHQVDLGRFVVAAHRGGTSIDVAVNHPLFMDIGEDEAAQLTYLALDTYLGEELVETWLGEVSWPGETPLDAFPLKHLRGVVTEFASGWRTPEGEPRWAVLQGSGPTGSPVLAMAQVPLRQITFPLFDTHVAVVMPYADATAEGLPGPGSLDALREVEDRIAAAVGRDGRVVAHQSHEGVRLLHLYVDGRTDVADRVAAVAAEWVQGDAQTVVTHDPGWSLVNHLAG